MASAGLDVRVALSPQTPLSTQLAWSFQLGPWVENNRSSGLSLSCGPSSKNCWHRLCLGHV